MIILILHLEMSKVIKPRRRSATLADIGVSIRRRDGGKGFPPYLGHLCRFHVSTDMQLNDGANRLNLSVPPETLESPPPSGGRVNDVFLPLLVLPPTPSRGEGKFPDGHS